MIETRFTYVIFVGIKTIFHFFMEGIAADSLGFMFFSTLETLAIYSLTMSLFRYKTSEYIWQALCMMLLVNLQSFVMRNEMELAYLVPLITVIIFVFFFAAVVKIPVMWSAICAILGYVFYMLIQVFYVYTLFGSIEAAQSTVSNGYILQVITATTGLITSWIMYKFGFGFAFDFERLRFKFEHFLLIALITTVFILLAILFYYNRLWLLFIFFGLTFGGFFYYSIKTDRRDIS